jgi:hypothetical protein
MNSGSRMVNAWLEAIGKDRHDPKMTIHRGDFVRFHFLLFLFFSGMGEAIAQTGGKDISVGLERLVDQRSQAKEESRLVVTLKIQGDGIARALEFGAVQIQEPGVMSGKISGADEEGFAALRRSGFGGNLSEAFLSFELPSPARTQISWPVVSGSFKLKLYRQQLVPIEKVLSKRNQVVEDPLLKAHKIELRVVDPRQAFPGVTEDVEVSKLLASVVALEIIGNTRQVREFLLETPEGKRIPTRAGSFGAGRTLILSQRSEEPLAENVVAKVVIPVAPEQVEVPFLLEKVELP